MISYHGKIYIVDETDVGGYSTETLEETFSEINNFAIEETGHGIDICVIDHVNLLKFGDAKYNVIDTVNKYTTFFRQQSINWCKTKEQVAMIVIAQSNRDGGEYARKHKGNYLLGHFAEGNELERASSVVLTVYSDDDLKILNQVNVGLIKNRDGTPLQYAFQVAIEPKYYTFGNKVLIAAREAENNIPSLEEALGIQPQEPVEIDWGV